MRRQACGMVQQPSHSLIADDFTPAQIQARFTLMTLVRGRDPEHANYSPRGHTACPPHTPPPTDPTAQLEPSVIPAPTFQQTQQSHLTLACLATAICFHGKQWGQTGKTRGSKRSLRAGLCWTNLASDVALLCRNCLDARPPDHCPPPRVFPWSA